MDTTHLTESDVDLQADERSDDRTIDSERTVARQGLHWACERLAALAASNATKPATFHQVVSAIHDLCEALNGCESAGIRGADLRRLVAPARDVHGRSPFVRRLQEWPRGYPGDFETIEWLCRAENRAPENSVGYVVERYALAAAIAQQHRNKVTFQAARMLEAIARRADCRVLSLACGSNPDLRSIRLHAKPATTFVLCDGDADALAYSREELSGIGASCKYVHGMIPRVLRSLRADGPYDLILAGGLFDYLSDRLIEHTLSTAWHSLLAPGGVIVFTNIAVGNPFRTWLEYVADWKLIERSEEEITALCGRAGIPVAPVLTREATGLAIMATLTKGT